MLKGTVLARRRALTVCAVAVLSIWVSSAFAADPLTVFGTDGNDILNGTSVAESFYARAGNDKVNGLGGDDEFDGGPGADALSGGDGVDVVSYTGTAPVTVTLDGTADDGAAGEGDNVAPDVEDVLAGDGADKLTGSDAANTLDGGAGDDRIDGGKGSDSLIGGAGDDTINARDSQADSIDCGDGNDTAIIDRVDVTVGCENTEKPPVTQPVTLANAYPPDGPTIRRIRLSGVATKSSVLVTCVSGCAPASSRSRVIAQTKSAQPRNGFVMLRLSVSPRVRGGSTILISVAAQGARGRCFAVRFSKRLDKVKRWETDCRSVAKE